MQYSSSFAKFLTSEWTWYHIELKRSWSWSFLVGHVSFELVSVHFDPVLIPSNFFRKERDASMERHVF